MLFLRIKILFIFSNLLCGLARPAEPIQLWPGMHLILIQLLLSPKWTSWSSPLLFSCSVLPDSAIPWTTAPQASLSFTISWNLLKLMSIESVMPSNHLNLCHPLFLSIFPSIRVFSSDSALRIRWPKEKASASASALSLTIQGLSRVFSSRSSL